MVTPSFGLKYSSIQPNLIENNNSIVSENGISNKIYYKPGTCFGFEIRHDFNKLIVLQSGFDLLKKQLDVIVFNGLNTERATILYSGTEIHIGGLSFIRLSKSLYMGVSVGSSFDMFSIDANYNLAVLEKPKFMNIGARTSIGIERKSEKIGNFYIGAMYKLYFQDVMHLNIHANGVSNSPTATTKVSGNHVGIVFKYFFPYKKVLPFTDPDFV